MHVARQQFIQNLTYDQLNELLGRGARVVWIEHKSGVGAVAVVLETYVEAEQQPEMIVLDFLATVPPEELERRILEGEPPEKVGEGALRVLREMVTGAA